MYILYVYILHKYSAAKQLVVIVNCSNSKSYLQYRTSLHQWHFSRPPLALVPGSPAHAGGSLVLSWPQKAFLDTERKR